MLANAFEALKTFDWGADLAELGPIEDAAVAAHTDANAGQDLENRLVAALNGSLSRDAHDYVCRKLAIVGTAACVPTLAALLGNKATAHMARYALERITAPEAAEALRKALGTTSGELKIGVISSVGSRRDEAAAEPLGKVLADRDPACARAAALALGTIGTTESANILKTALTSGTGDKQAIIDGLFACAEALLAAGKPADAQSIYVSLSGDQQGRLIRLAATRGLLTCAGKRA